MTAELGTLLVVDDDELNRDMLSRRLERKGYCVVVSPDGPGALALAAGQVFDLVLLDVMMPGLGGLEVLKLLRERHSATELPVIMATARDQSEEIVHALHLGANDYVTKPLDFPVVMARIETQLLLKRSVAETVRLKQDLAERNQALEESNLRLRQINRRMEHDLRTAARIQASLLPRRIPTFASARFTWHFEPCDELAGDSLNVVTLDDRRVGIYVLDVSGHGVASALLSVTLSRLLSSPRDPSSVLVRPVDELDGDGSRGLPMPPSEVADELSRRFPFDPAIGQYFTIIYGLFNVITGEFQYVSAGHPGVAFVPVVGPPRIIDLPGFPIGLGADPYESRSLRLEPGDRLYLYSDGVTEAMSPADVLYGPERMLSGLLQGRSMPLASSVSSVLTDVRAWSGGRLRDDVSLVAVEFGPAVGADGDSAVAEPKTGRACDDPRATARTAGVP